MLNIKEKSVINRAFTLGALFSLIYFAFAYYSLGDRPWIFFNSDNMAPTFYEHIKYYGEHISQWQFASVTDFFPDIFAFFILGLFMKNIMTIMIVFGTLQLLAFYGLVVAVGQQIIKDENNIVLFRLSAFSAIVLLAAGCFTHKEIMESAFVSWLHFGVALMGLTSLWLVLKSYSQASLFKYSVLFAICFLTVFSDLLFIVHFSVPALMSIAVLWLVTGNKNANTHIKLTVVITLATLLGYLLYTHNAFGFVNMNHETQVLRRTHADDIMAAFLKLRLVFGNFAQINPMMVFAFLVFFVIASKQVVQRFAQLTRKETHATKPVDDRIFFTILFFWVSIIVGICSLLVLDNDLMAANYFGLRHYQPFMLFSVFIGVPLLLSRYAPFGEIANKLYYYLVLTMLVCAYLTSQEGSLKKLRHFYPPSVACLDQFSTQYQLQNGIANYWEARSYQFLSKKQLNIAAVNNELKPYIQINNRADYANKDFTFLVVQNTGTLSPSYAPGYSPEFNFSHADVIKALGKPIKVLECPAPFADGKEKIYVFKSGQIGVVFNHMA